ncbi:hypothetical protein A9Q96_13290 [Rhodobacterales bacterium 52_120_T64]|nr:hypothetical protein A9Q96_13290 [Rhodobacterales bacterium 52_120_T64]
MFTSVLFGFLAVVRPVAAHEFWLDALDYTLETGQELQVDIRVGQDFKGNNYSFNPNLFYDFSLTSRDGKVAVDGRIGDQPAVAMTPVSDGLIVVNHFSTTQLLTYEDDGKFEDFVRNKGLDWVLEKHIARGLPEVGFGEGYTRFAKSLVAVGDGVGRDAHTGMPFELVALQNPYTDNISNGLPVRLFFGTDGLADIQIDIFRRPADGSEVVKTHVVTNETGLAFIPINSGDTYLINAVHMIIPPAEDIERTTAVWHSLWASMTFKAGLAGE